MPQRICSHLINRYNLGRTLIAVSIRAFATDPQGFTRIREDSRMDSRMDSRGFADPGFPRIPHGFTRIRGFAYADSRKFATDIRRFADGFTRIRESLRMDIRRFAQGSQRLAIIPRRESANGHCCVSHLGQ